MRTNPFLALLFLGNISYGQDTFDVANGDDRPLPGDIVPDNISFAMVPGPAVNTLQLPGSSSFSFILPELENRSYSDFPNEVVITVYHTPW